MVGQAIAPLPDDLRQNLGDESSDSVLLTYDDGQTIYDPSKKIVKSKIPPK